MGEGVMVKRMVAELEGDDLDLMVGVAVKAEGLMLNPLGKPSTGRGLIRYRPSTDWSECGPLIERYRVGIVNATDRSGPAAICKNVRWTGGETVPIAVCRAIVASELGEEVEIPEELANA